MAQSSGSTARRRASLPCQMLAASVTATLHSNRVDRTGLGADRLDAIVGQEAPENVGAAIGALDVRQVAAIGDDGKLPATQEAGGDARLAGGEDAVVTTPDDLSRDRQATQLAQ